MGNGFMYSPYCWNSSNPSLGKSDFAILDGNTPRISLTRLQLRLRRGHFLNMSQMFPCLSSLIVFVIYIISTTGEVDNEIRNMARKMNMTPRGGQRIGMFIKGRKDRIEHDSAFHLSD